MGLKCTLLGHDWGDPEVERDREERGDEVVVSVREIRECTRCGEEYVASENTEVRPVEPAPESVEGGDAGDEVADAAGFDAGPDGGVGGEFEPPDDAAEDDGVILDDEPAGADEREAGEWPAADDTRLDEQETADHAATPEDAGAVEGAADEAPDAAADADRSVDVGAEADEDGIIDADAVEGTGDDAPPVEEAEPEPSPDAGDAGDDQPSPGGGTAGGGGGTAGGGGGGTLTLVCPSCGFAETAIESSHRAGDICPECGRDYLDEE